MTLPISSQRVSLWGVIDPLEIDVRELDHTLYEGPAKGLQTWKGRSGCWMAHPDEPHDDDVLIARKARSEGCLPRGLGAQITDRKSTRLNSSHRCISYAVFCLKKKKKR